MKREVKCMIHHSQLHNYLGSCINTSARDGASPPVAHKTSPCDCSTRDAAIASAQTVLCILVHIASLCQPWLATTLLRLPLRAAFGRTSPFLPKALRNVTSMANCAPLQHRKSCAKTSMFLSSMGATPTFMSRRRELNFTRAPASRQTRAITRSTGIARFLKRPVLGHAALCLSRGSRGLWHATQVASVTSKGNRNLSKTNTRKRYGGMVNSGAVGTCDNAIPAL